MSRDMDLVANTFVNLWINSHGPPKFVSADREFSNPSFVSMLKKNGIRIEERPVRRHNKIGIVESGHASIRLFAERLLKDAEYYRLNRGLPISTTDILSKASFLNNSLRR